MADIETVYANEIKAQTPTASKLRGVPFDNVLASGESLTGTPSVTDPSGTLTIANVALDGNTVQFRVTGGVVGTTYTLLCSCATDTSDTEEVRAYLKIE